MTVYEAINAVQEDLAKEGISKARKNQQQGYSFRGIDDVFNALSPLLAKHKLCILPRCLSRECAERTNKSGSALFYVTVEAEFDFVSAVDGSKHTVKTFGEAMDSADKATNKAMSAAYKYAAFQAFAIPTEGDNDADATPHEVNPASNALNPAQTTPPQVPSGRGINEKQTGKIKARLEDCVKSTSSEKREVWDRFCEAFRVTVLEQLPWNQMDNALKWIEDEKSARLAAIAGREFK